MNKPPKPRQLQSPATPEDFIKQGGQPSEVARAQPSTEVGKPYKAFSLRLDPDMMTELQEIRDSQPKLRPTSIHTFIVQAIAEKIARAKKKSTKKSE